MRPYPSFPLLSLRLAACLAGLIGLSVASAEPARAAINLALDPDQTQVDPLATVDVEVTVAGLGNGIAPSIGVFELNVTFDSTLLSPGAPIYGDPLLGDQLALNQNSNTSTGLGNPGIANLFELSLDSVQDLDTMQAPAFTMVTIPFTALKRGRATVGLSIVDLGNAGGMSLVATAQGTTIQIPEPGSALAGSMALAAIGLLRRRRNALVALAAAALLAAPVAVAQSAVPGDVDQNGRVDRADLAIVSRDRGVAVGESQCGAACDLDGDGTITALDARMLASLCTVAGCGPAAPAQGSDGPE